MKPFDEDDFESFFTNREMPYPNPFNNEEFQRYIAKKINETASYLSINPGKSAKRKSRTEKTNKTQAPTEDLHEFINNQIRSSLHNYHAKAPQNKPEVNNEEIFETLDFIIIKIPISDTKNELPKIFINSYECLFGNDQSSLHRIVLPKPIQPQNTEADYRNGTLEIRMLKKDEEPHIEVTINNNYTE